MDLRPFGRDQISDGPVFANVTRAGISSAGRGLVATVENGHMTSWSRIAVLPAAAMATFALAGCGGGKATLDTFAGTWQAHGRTLKIHADR